MNTIDSIHLNRIMHNICAVSIKKQTKSGKDVKSYASFYFGKNNPYLREIIDAAPVIYDAGSFQRKSWALYEKLVSPEDFTSKNEVMLIKTSVLEQLCKKVPGLKSSWYTYFNMLIPVESATITKEDIAEAQDAINRICLNPYTENKPPVYTVMMTPSVEKGCLMGFVPRKQLYDIVSQHNPKYIEKKAKQECIIIDGELRIKLW